MKPAWPGIIVGTVSACALLAFAVLALKLSGLSAVLVHNRSDARRDVEIQAGRQVVRLSTPPGAYALRPFLLKGEGALSARATCPPSGSVSDSGEYVTPGYNIWASVEVGPCSVDRLVVTTF